MKMFESVAQMKLSSLQTGQNVGTRGYTTAGDERLGLYLVVAPQAADEINDHVLANGNVAVLQASVNVLTEAAGINTAPTTGTNGQIVRNTSDNSFWLVTGGTAYKLISGYIDYKDAAYDPASVPANSNITADITVTGAAITDYIIASFSLPLGGLVLFAEVSAADTVKLTFVNNTAGAIDLAAGILNIRVIKNSLT